MLHIRQKNSITESGYAYTVVDSSGYGGLGEPPLTSHPAVVEWPDKFEVVDQELPEEYQILNYTG